MIKRLLIMLGCVGILFGGIFSYQTYKFYKLKKSMKAKPTAVTVSAVEVKRDFWQSTLKAVGNLRALKGVEVTTEVPGLVTQIYFNSGEVVREGDVLLELNADSELAHLKSLEALVKLAEITYARDQKQFKVHAVSQAVLDSDLFDLEAKRAERDEWAALIEKKMIRAPFSGRLGITFINLGQYLNAGDKIVTLQTIDPILVDFTFPQQFIAQIKMGQDVSIRVDSYPEKVFKGKVSAINPKIDADTRNVQVEAYVFNPEGELLPGMFVSVELLTGDPTPCLTLPQSAISYNPYGEIVYIVKESGKDEKGHPQLVVDQSFITIGETRGDQVAILKGIQEGDRIVTSGQMKLKNKTPVIINNSISLPNDPNPAVTTE